MIDTETVTEFSDLINDIADNHSPSGVLKVVREFLENRFGSSKIGDPDVERRLEYGDLKFYGETVTTIVVDKLLVDIDKWKDLHPDDVSRIRQAVIQAGLCLYDWNSHATYNYRVMDDHVVLGIRPISG